MPRVGRGKEGPGDGLVEPACRRCAAQLALERLPGRRRRAGDPIGAREGDALDSVEPVDADDLFDDVGRAFDIVAAQRSGDRPIRGYREVERGKRAALLFFGDGDAAE